jgi:hypothetical protein
VVGVRFDVEYLDPRDGSDGVDDLVYHILPPPFAEIGYAFDYRGHSLGPVIDIALAGN